MERFERNQPVHLCSTNYTPNNHDAELSPIIFLHGLFSSSLTWNRVMRIIAEKTKRQVRAVDLRNHGNSEWTEEMHIKSLVADLENFMSVETISEAILICHSYGGLLGMALCLSKPHLVQKIVLEDSTLSDMFDQFCQKGNMLVTSMINYIHRLPPSMSEKQAHTFLSQVITDTYKKIQGNVSNDSVQLEKLKPEVFPFHKNKETGCFEWLFNANTIAKAIKNGDLKLDLTDSQPYQKPTLFMFAENTFLKPKNDREQQMKYFPHSEQHIIKNTYHNLHLESPDEYVEMVVKFLQN